MPILTAEMVLNPGNDLAQSNQIATLGALRPGVAGVRQTLALMVSVVKQYRKNPDIRAFAETIIQNVPQKDAVAEVRAVFNWVQNNIRYTQDIRDVETLKTPDITINTGHGDCDDQATLIATLVETIGYAARFVAIGMAQSDAFEHVYAEVKLGTTWVALDTTEPNPMGWKPKNPAAYLVRHI